MDVLNRFNLHGKIAVITGGAGLLGVEHARAIAEAGGTPVLWDVNEAAAKNAAIQIAEEYECPSFSQTVDITKPESVQDGLETLLHKFSKVDILINNAANDPKVGSGTDLAWSRLENFPLNVWNQDIAVGLTGAMLCSQAIGAHMAKNGSGVILNIASDLGLIAPDQRLYRKEGLPEEKQPVKPVTYSVIKHGLIGLTRYLATYWAEKGVRCNALAPGGVYTNQDEEFVRRLESLVPLGRMAGIDEYKAAVVFMVSDASSYMMGEVISMDGGRTVW